MMKRRTKVAELKYAFLCLLVLCPITLFSTEIRVGTEYRYPTSFNVTPITGTGAGGGTTVTGGIVEPVDFETRFVGVSMYVEAYVGQMTGTQGVIAGLKIINGNTDLMIAATLGDSREVKKALIVNPDTINKVNRFGSTALMGASAGGYEGIVKTLLAAGAEVDVVSESGSTALMFAARNGNLAVTKKLLSRDAGVNVADKKGLTPLMYAVKGGYKNVVTALAKKGADLKAMDNSGQTPLILASQQKDRQIVVLLTKLGAKK